MNASPLILGLSHLYGESRDLGAAARFWTSRGFREAFTTRLPVPREKRETLLGAGDSVEVEMIYLERVRPSSGAGVEFLDHGAHSKRGGSRMVLVERGDAREDQVDPDGNRLLRTPEWTGNPGVIAAVPPSADPVSVLLKLGFRASGEWDEAAASRWLGISDAGPVRWFDFHNPLFPGFSCRLGIRADARLSDAPRVDDAGWNGLSFVTRDLERVGAHLPLAGNQEFVEADRKRAVAFYRGEGILIEFLRISAR